MSIHPTPSNQPTGQQAKDKVLLLLEATRDGTINQARRALIQTLLTRSTATTDDVRDEVETPPNVNPTCFGAVPGALARAGVIEQAGYAPSRRKVAHARIVKVWRLADRHKAETWLAEHPDMPDPINDAEPGKNHWTN